MEPAPVVDIRTGEVRQGCEECENTRIAYEELNAKYKHTLTQLGKEKKKTKVQLFREAEAVSIIEVLRYWRDRCTKRPDQIVMAEGGKRWAKVRDRLKDELVDRDPFTPDELKISVDGALANPDLNGTAGHTNGKQYLDATTVFRDPEMVEKNLKIGIKFQEHVGVFPSVVLRSLIGLDMKTELELCDCSHPRLLHVGVQETGGREVCKRCDCGGFSSGSQPWGTT